jgi:hypothetical protein
VFPMRYKLDYYIRRRSSVFKRLICKYFVLYTLAVSHTVSVLDAVVSPKCIIETQVLISAPYCSIAEGTVPRFGENSGKRLRK